MEEIEEKKDKRQKLSNEEDTSDTSDTSDTEENTEATEESTKATEKNTTNFAQQFIWMCDLFNAYANFAKSFNAQLKHFVYTRQVKESTYTKRRIDSNYKHYQEVNHDKKKYDGRSPLSAKMRKDLHRWVLSTGYVTKWRTEFFAKKPNNKRFPDLRVTTRWLVCYLNNILPDQTKAGWEYFECSHLCIGSCLTPECFFWESKSINQSRSNYGCGLVCHCGCQKSVCVANDVHLPHCK